MPPTPKKKKKKKKTTTKPSRTTKTKTKTKAPAKAKTKTKTKTPARRTPSTRTTAKVSPKRGMSVATWVETETDGWQRDVVTRVLALAAEALPGATQVIKWGQPVVEQGGPIAYLKVASAHVTFGLWRGAQLEDPDGHLEGGDRMKHLKLRSLDDIDVSRLMGWLEAAAKLNADHGSPAQR